jgi:SH3 domain protein
MNKAPRLLLILLLGPVAAAQETVYVTDILRLGIHHTEDTSDRPFQNLISGTELTVLQRKPNFARVRTPDGQEGWVKSAFLVTEKPAQLIVSEVRAELESAQAELKSAREAKLAAEAEAARVVNEVKDDVSSAQAIKDTLARLQQENESYEARIDQYRGAVPLSWVAGALVLALIAGFVAGYWWLDASIRRRYGGFRVY